MSFNEISLCLTFNCDFQRQFNINTYCVVEMYWSYLRKYETEKIKKVVIKVKDLKNNEPVSLYGTTGSIIDTCVLFDFEFYFKSSNCEKKKMLLEAVHEGMNKIALDEGWKTEPLKKAYEACLAKNLAHSFYMKKGVTKSSPNRQYKIGFFCEWELEYFLVYWVLYDKKNKELKRKQFIKTKSAYHGVGFYYVKWKWLDNYNVYFDESRYTLGEDYSCTIHLEDELKEIE